MGTPDVELVRVDVAELYLEESKGGHERNVVKRLSWELKV